MKVGISRRHVFQNLWSKLAYFTAPQVTHAQTIYSLTYISEAEFSAVIIQLFAQKRESLYPPRPVASAIIHLLTVTHCSSIVDIPPSLGDIPEILLQPARF